MRKVIQFLDAKTARDFVQEDWGPIVLAPRFYRSYRLREGTAKTEFWRIHRTLKGLNLIMVAALVITLGFLRLSLGANIGWLAITFIGFCFTFSHWHMQISLAADDGGAEIIEHVTKPRWRNEIVALDRTWIVQGMVISASVAAIALFSNFALQPGVVRWWAVAAVAGAIFVYFDLCRSRKARLGPDALKEVVAGEP